MNEQGYMGDRATDRLLGDIEKAKITTTQYINLIDLIDGLESAACFDEHPHEKYTWGDCTLSLIHHTRIFDGWEDGMDDDELAELRRRISALPIGCLIALP